MAHAQTENDKLHEARRKDYEANLKATKDVDASERTSAHDANDGLLPSDVDGFATRHGLTTAEAADVMGRTDNGRASGTDKAVQAAKDARVVNRPVVIEQPAGISHPLQAEDVSVPPVPPHPSALDVTAPGPQDPTAHVIREDAEERRAEEVKAAAGGYVKAADELTEQVDEEGVADAERTDVQTT